MTPRNAEVCNPVARGPGRPPIPVDRIVGAALQILDVDGSDALSLRSVAKALNSSTATLYRHFPTRAALAVSVIDRVLGEVDTRPEKFHALAWRQACQVLAEDIFETFRRHRQTALLLADHTPTGPNAARVRERTLAILIDGRFDVPEAARAAAMIGHLILGFAIQLGGERDATDADREAFRKAIHGMDLDEFPATAAVKKARWRPTTVDQEFTFALELVLDGLSALHEG